MGNWNSASWAASHDMLNCKVRIHFSAELQPNSMHQAGQCLTNKQLFNKLIVDSNLIYCMLLNPAPGTERSACSRVTRSCSLRKKSLLYGPDLSWWNTVRWGNANSRDKPWHSTISSMQISLFLQQFPLPSFPALLATLVLLHQVLSTGKNGAPWRKIVLSSQN